MIDGYSDAPKLFHFYIRKKKGRLAVGPLRQPSGQVVDDPREIAKLFADTFVSVFVRDAPVDPAPY